MDMDNEVIALQNELAACKQNFSNLQDTLAKAKMRTRHEFDLLDKIFATYAQNGDPFIYLKKNGYNKFSIYGNDQLAEILWDATFMADYTVEYLVNHSAWSGKSLVAPEKLEFQTPECLKNLSSNDLVILAFPAYADHIYNRLSKITRAKIVYLIDLIEYGYKYASVVKPMSQISAMYPGTQFILCNYPVLHFIKNRSEREQQLFKLLQSGIKAMDMVNAISDYWYILAPLYEPFGFSQKYVSDVFRKTNELSQYTNRRGGHRLTTDLPENPIGTVYMFGNSITDGFGTDDSNTIASSLQRCLNNFYGHESPYAVMNCSRGGGTQFHKMLNFMESFQYNKNDIVVLTIQYNDFEYQELSKEFVCCNVLPIFDRPHNMGEIMIDSCHMNHIGYNALAKALFDTLFEKNLLLPHEEIANRSEDKAIDGILCNKTENVDKMSEIPLRHEQSAKVFDQQENAELAAYIDTLSKTKIHTDGRVGAIVINCNPFTLGHQYLIKKAAGNVAHLYVFVVEEDKSFFPFADRIELLKQGVADLANVTVLPSGKYIISTLTFEGYFDKEKISDELIDPSLDVKIFAEKIAPALDISVRFVGEEPFCNITRQYNQTMRAIFPKHGIELVIIPRVASDTGPISASEVRTLLENKDFMKIAKLVPQTTYDYLYAKFGGGGGNPLLVQQKILFLCPLHTQKTQGTPSLAFYSYWPIIPSTPQLFRPKPPALLSDQSLGIIYLPSSQTCFSA